MEYSFWADVLSKYYASVPAIQALIVLSVAATIVGAMLCACLAIKAFSPYQHQSHKSDTSLERAVEIMGEVSNILITIRKSKHYQLTPERQQLLACGRNAAHELQCLFDYVERKKIERSKCVSENSENLL